MSKEEDEFWTDELHPVLRDIIPNYDRLRPMLVHAKANITQMKINMSYDLKTLSDLEQAFEVIERIKNNHQTNVQYFKSMGITLDTSFYGQVYFTL